MRQYLVVEQLFIAHNKFIDVEFRSSVLYEK